jgi:hypothetical protein
MSPGETSPGMSLRCWRANAHRTLGSSIWHADRDAMSTFDTPFSDAAANRKGLDSPNQADRNYRRAGKDYQGSIARRCEGGPAVRARTQSQSRDRAASQNSRYRRMDRSVYRDAGSFLA